MTRPLIFLLATAFLISYSQISDATVMHCVANGNQLNSALALAATNDDNDIIKVEQGTLTTNSHAPTFAQWLFEPDAFELTYSLTLSGGWSKGNNCAQQSNLNPTATVLDAQYFGPVFFVHMYDYSGDRFQSTVHISNLTLTRGQSHYNLGAGLDVTAVGGIGASIIVDNLLVTASKRASGNNNAVDAVQLSMGGAGYLRFRNNIVYANTPSASSVHAIFTDLASGMIHNNSIFGNQITQGSTVPGLSVSGVATLANNAVAENDSSAAGVKYQFYSSTGSSLTLSKNHFGNQSIVGGTPIGMSTTTTGDPMWTLSGSLPIPDAGSPLRDSGSNAPLGGIPSIDFRGSARIIASTIDRGAVEAAAIPNIGPAITSVSPAPGSTTALPAGNVGDFISTPLSFSVAGGSGAGTTSLQCVETAGTIATIGFASQVIAVGGTVSNVRIYFSITETTQTGSVRCTVTPQSGSVSQYDYHFSVPAGNAQGPVLADVSPGAGSITELTAVYEGETVGASIVFTAIGGSTGASTSLNCSVASGTASITGNGSQTIVTGGSVLPVNIAFQASPAPQEAHIDCITVRQGVASSLTRNYTFNLSAAVMLFEDSFD